MTCSPTCTEAELPTRATRMALVTRSSCSNATSAAVSAEKSVARTTSPPMPSTVISSMALTTCAAVITLPSLEIRTPVGAADVREHYSRLSAASQPHSRRVWHREHLDNVSYANWSIDSVVGSPTVSEQSLEVHAAWAYSSGNCHCLSLTGASDRRSAGWWSPPAWSGDRDSRSCGLPSVGSRAGAVRHAPVSSPARSNGYAQARQGDRSACGWWTCCKRTSRRPCVARSSARCGRPSGSGCGRSRR